MTSERRGAAVSNHGQANKKLEELAASGKPFDVSKHTVWEAWERVKRKRGSAGVDSVTIQKYEENIQDNLYKLWNRMSSGSYFPSPVKEVEIPKKDGKTRTLGIPTVEDRVAQMTVVLYLQERFERLFVEDSYGYRSGKSALDAVRVCKDRCWEADWVVDLDIKGMFDNIDHTLLLSAVSKHVKEDWMVLYIKRWLTSSLLTKEGKEVARVKGTPQGGVISPLLANVFMHYVFDAWMKRNHPSIPFERYADDCVVHCKTQGHSEEVLAQIDTRLAECKLELHPQKTKIVYCKDRNRTLKHKGETRFDFLGYTFGAIRILDRAGRLQYYFLATASKSAQSSFRHKLKKLAFHRWSDYSLSELADYLNPILRGWFTYFTAFGHRTIKFTVHCIQKRLTKWAMRKFKRFKRHRQRAAEWLDAIRAREPNLFAHWKFCSQNGETVGAV